MRARTCSTKFLSTRGGGSGGGGGAGDRVGVRLHAGSARESSNESDPAPKSCPGRYIAYISRHAKQPADLFGAANEAKKKPISQQN